MGLFQDWARRTANRINENLAAEERREKATQQAALRAHAIEAMGKHSLGERSALREGPVVIVGVVGPAHAGKTTLLQRVRDKMAGAGPLVSALPSHPAITAEMHASGEYGRFLFFDVAPRPDFPVVRFATVPGAVYYDAARIELFGHTDVFVFVADADPERAFANEEMLQNVNAHLASAGRSLDDNGWVLHVNKLDLAAGDGIESVVNHIDPLRRASAVHGTTAIEDVAALLVVLNDAAKLAIGAYRRGVPPRATSR
jgi:50S ribosomal subunit-associated GTPase HflX